MSLKDFLTSSVFLRHLLIAFAAGIVIIWGSLRLLDAYTHHGRTISVPDLEGLQEAEVWEQLSGMHLRYTVNDSIFDDSREQGSVSSQDPAPGTEVKRNRTIYLTVVATTPEMVPMPDLTDLSLRQALNMLDNHGLLVGLLEYAPDIARNAVLEQKYLDEPIDAGTLIQKGSAIDLVLGEGLGEHQVQVPLVIGLSVREAAQLLNAHSLNVGEETHLDEEKSAARVYRQSPDPLRRRQFLQAGSSVDLTYRSDRDFDFEAYLEELLTVPVPLLFGKTPEEVRNTLAAFGLEMGLEVFEFDVDQAEARVHRQEPPYEEDALIRKGSKIDVWYRPISAFDLEGDTLIVE